MYDVIGYVEDGDIYCHEHAKTRVSPVLDDEESDSPIHCGECHEFLGGLLTADGVKRIIEDWRDYNARNREAYETYMERWPYLDWFFMPTFLGWMNPITGDIKDA